MYKRSLTTLTLTAAAIGVAGLIALQGCSSTAQSSVSEVPHVGYGHDVDTTIAYLEACGDCHYAYPPQLLPTNSWQNIMANLDNHYDDNAELEDAQWQVISNYLSNMSGGWSPLYRQKYDGKSPERITKLRYFTYEHHDFPSEWVEDNPQVGSFSNCNSCHMTTSRGRLFDEHSVKIPGVKFD